MKRRARRPEPRRRGRPARWSRQLVVYVRDFLGRPEGAVPFAPVAYGIGSMTVALVLPRVLETVSDRAVMLPSALLPGALLVAVVFAGLSAVTGAPSGSWRRPAPLGIWAVFGAACAAVLTPTGRLIRRSAPAEERTAAFAAQVSLSHGYG